MNMSIRASLLCEWAEILCVCVGAHAPGGGGGFVHHRRSVLGAQPVSHFHP